ncbi:MAG: response regulator [Nitrospiraceae bacterium]
MIRILIIDDDDQVREMLREALETEGYQVSEAKDGRQAIEQDRRCPSDLIILDIFMPEQDGLETLQQFRQQSPARRIIGISGGSQRVTLDVLDVAQKLGAVQTLQKPFPLSTMLEMVRSVLSSGDAELS